MYKYNLECNQYDDWALEERENQYIEKKMEDYRKRAVGKFSSIAPHLDFREKIAVSICYAYRDSIPESEDIIKKLNLDDMEICAIELNFETFKDLYVKHMYESSIDDDYYEGVI